MHFADAAIPPDPARSSGVVVGLLTGCAAGVTARAVAPRPDG